MRLLTKVDALAGRGLEGGKALRSRVVVVILPIVQAVSGSRQTAATPTFLSVMREITTVDRCREDIARALGIGMRSRARVGTI